MRSDPATSPSVRRILSWLWPLGIGSLLVLGACCDHATTSPNLILVTLDTTRADRLGCYGWSRAVTPVLDSLASSGILFEQAYTSVPVTLPAHASILTGVYPTRHGVRDNGIFSLGDRFETVAEVLQAEGYQTAAFVSAFVLAPEFGTAQGFEIYDAQFYNERSAALTSRRAARWLKQIDAHRPFFLWVHYYDPHLPYRPREPFRSIPGLNDYDREIAAMDAGFGWLLRALDEADLDGDTDILIVGDHGEGLGDHGEGEHGLFLYDATLQVPLLLVRHDERDPGRRVEHVASVQDVAPTLLALAGLDFTGAVDGVDLRHVAEGRYPNRQIYAETWFPVYNFQLSQLFCLRTLEWKYISAPQPELYDLVEDEAEAHNLLERRPAKAAELAADLRSIRESTLGSTEGQSISEQDLQRLQSLGYLQAGDPGLQTLPDMDFVLPDPKEHVVDVGYVSEALAAVNDGRLMEARHLLERVLSESPDNPIANINLGQVLLKLGYPQASAEVLEHAQELVPKSESLRTTLAEAYRKTGQPQKALSVLRSAESGSENLSPGIRLEIIRTLLQMDRLTDAQHELTVLLQKSPEAPQVVGLAQQLEAYKNARDALHENPADEELRLALASSALDLNLFEAAREAVAFTTNDDQIQARQHVLRGSIAGKSGDEQSALSEYELAFEAMPDDPYLRVQLAGLYLGAQRPAQALALLEELRDEGVTSPIVDYNRACAFAQLGRVESGLQALESAVHKGYRNLYNMSEDSDLAPLRGDERFFQIMDQALDMAAPDIESQK